MFSYTDVADSKKETISHFYWEELDEDRFFDIQYVLEYYQTIKMLTNVQCAILELSKGQLDELIVLCGLESVPLRQADMDNWKELVKSLPILNEVRGEYSTDKDVLGCISFFNKNWYLPKFNAFSLECSEVCSTLSPTTLMKWYKGLLKSITPANDVIPWSTYQVIEKRCESLTKPRKIQEPVVIVDNPADNPVVAEDAPAEALAEAPLEILVETIEEDKVEDQAYIPIKDVIYEAAVVIPVPEDLGEYIKNQPDSTKNMIEMYLTMYLEPLESVKQYTTLLSDVYQDYKKRIEKTPYVVVSQAVFLKQLRSHSEYKIVRHASGMKLTNYVLISVAKRPEISYSPITSLFEFQNANMLKDVERFIHSSPAGAMIEKMFPKVKSAFLMMRTLTNLSPTFESIMLLLTCDKMAEMIDKYDTQIGTIDSIKEELKTLPSEYGFSTKFFDKLMKKLNEYTYVNPIQKTISYPYSHTIMKKKIAHSYEPLVLPMYASMTSKLQYSTYENGQDASSDSLSFSWEDCFSPVSEPAWSCINQHLALDDNNYSKQNGIKTIDIRDLDMISKKIVESRDSNVKQHEMNNVERGVDGLRKHDDDKFNLLT